MSGSFRLRHVARINPATPEFDRLPGKAEVTFLPLEAVWPGARLDTTRTRPKLEISTGYTRFKEGDVLLPKITPTFEADRSVIAQNLIGGIGAGTTELHVVRPQPGTDARYIKYLLSSRPFLLGGEAEMIGVAGQKRVPDAWLRDFRVPVVDNIQQRVIADFLDAETARIDTLTSKKRRLVNLLAERRSGLIETEIRGLADQFGSVRLKTAVSAITVGIVVTPSNWYADNGVPALRGVNVKPGRIDLEDMVYLSPEGQRLHQKSILFTGDVVVVRTGQAGATASIPSSLDGVNCIDLLIIRPGNLSSGYLVNVLNSDWTQKHIRKHSVGTIQSHFNVGTMAELPMPVPPLHIQEAALERIAGFATRIDRTLAALDRQVGLLHEHRQALITAAVRGELL